MPPATSSPPVRRRIGASRTTLLLACSTLLALSSFAIAGLTGSGIGGGGLHHHARRHDETHRALRQSAVDAASVLRRAAEVNDDSNTSASSSSSSSPAVCTVEGKPNPISSNHPADISGNLNGTAMIVPIPLSQARAAVPAEYGLLESQWRRWLPDFPQGMYPMLAVGVYDHDLRFPAYNMSPPDFSVSLWGIVRER